MTTWIPVLTVPLATGLLVGWTVARLTGCGQCKAVRDQELTLIARLLGERDLQPVVRHRLQRRRPYTAAETLALLDANGALLTPERWSEIELLRTSWVYRNLPRGRAITAEPHHAEATS